MILSFILKKFLFRPVQDILSRREKEAEAIYDGANHEKHEAERLKRAYEEKISCAAIETNEMRSRAEDEIEQMKAEALDRALGEAAHIRENAKRQTEIERSRARDKLQAEISTLAVALAEKMLRRSINKEDQDLLIEEFMESTEFKQ